MKRMVTILCSALILLSLGCQRAETPESSAPGREVTVELPALGVEPAQQSKAPAIERVEQCRFGPSGVMTITRTEADGIASPDTKAGGLHAAFSNVWVLQFASDGAKLQCRNVGAVAADQPVTATLSEAVGSTIYVLANGPATGLDAVATNLTAFLAATEAVPADGVVSLWGKLDKVDVVTVNGMPLIQMPGGNPLLILLKPNAAQVNLTLDVTKAVGSTLKSVALRSVPDKGNCVSGATMPAGVGYTASWGSRTAAPFSWAMPQNRQGVVGSITGDAGRTHANSPAKATYARVTLGAATNDYRFDVFLGGGVTDFNVINNRTYNVKVTITGTEADFIDMAASDDRVATPSLDYTRTPANCYVSYPVKGKYPTIEFNALKKPIAKFAAGNATPVNVQGANPSAVDAGLENDIVYQAGDMIEVSWQTAVNHGTVGGADNMVIKSFALGADGIAKVEVNGPGNAVLSYKRGGVILWNYHIWATDSNPFVTHAINAGGNVNGKAEGGAQAGFMDRNLGALSATTAQPVAADAYKYFGVIYQHGRPTPFSGQGVGTVANTYTTIFDKAGAAISSGSIGGYTQSNTAVSSVTTAIQNPNTYYYKDMGSGYWSWYSVDISLWSDYGTNKSIYDPCPYGYRVPKSGDGAASSWYEFPSTRWINGAVDGGAVWSSTWWPAAGRRINNSGALAYVGIHAYYWSSTYYSAYSSYDLGFSYNGNVYPSTNGYRSYGSTVRCVQEGY